MIHHLNDDMVLAENGLGLPEGGTEAVSEENQGQPVAAERATLKSAWMRASLFSTATVT